MVARLAAPLGREALRDFVRTHAPDLRIRTGATPDGRQARKATFTFRGNPYEVEAIEGENGCTDADHTVFEHCAWVLRKALGIRTTNDVRQRRDLESKVLAAALSGDTKRTDELGLELAMKNERRVNRTQVRTRFER